MGVLHPEELAVTVSSMAVPSPVPRDWFVQWKDCWICSWVPPLGKWSKLNQNLYIFKLKVCIC